MSDLKMTGRDRKTRRSEGERSNGTLLSRWGVCKVPRQPAPHPPRRHLEQRFADYCQSQREACTSRGYASRIPQFVPASVDLLLAVRASCYLELFALDRPGVSGSGFISVQSLPEYLDEAAELRGTGIDTGWLPVSSGTEGASAG